MIFAFQQLVSYLHPHSSTADSVQTNWNYELVFAVRNEHAQCYFNGQAALISPCRQQKTKLICHSSILAQLFELLLNCTHCCKEDKLAICLRQQ